MEKGFLLIDNNSSPQLFCPLEPVKSPDSFGCFWDRWFVLVSEQAPNSFCRIHSFVVSPLSSNGSRAGPLPEVLGRQRLEHPLVRHHQLPHDRSLPHRCVFVCVFIKNSRCAPQIQFEFQEPKREGFFSKIYFAVFLPHARTEGGGGYNPTSISNKPLRL